MNKELKGELFILSETLLWSLFPIITVSSLLFFNPIVSLAWSTMFASVFFAVLLTYKQKWHELKNFSALYDILWVSLLIGVIYYGIYFFGLKYTSPANASLIALTEVFYSYLYFNVFRKEKISSSHLKGAILIVVGALIILLHGFTWNFSKGDLIILIGVGVAPFGNYFQQRARKKVSSEAISFGRSLFTSLFCILLSTLLGYQLVFDFHWHELSFLLLNGFISFGLCRILFLEGIHRISVTKAIALSSVGPLFTILFAWLFLHQIPALFQFIAFIPLTLGLVLLSKPNK